MDERNIGGGAEGSSSSAGPANTSGATGTGGGRPPSHREFHEGSSAAGGTTRTGRSETEQAFEEVRDQVARDAAPVVAEKVQEAVTESAKQIDVKEQAQRVATAVQHDAQRMAKEKVGEVTARAEESANEALSRAAAGLEGAARRLDDAADRYAGPGTSGVRATAGNMAHQVADAFESTAGYLRDNDVRKLQQDLERQVRQNPLQTLLIGVAAGWVVGKILR